MIEFLAIEIQMDFKIHEFKSKTLIEVVLKQNQLEGPIPISLIDHQLLHFFSFHEIILVDISLQRSAI